MVVWRLYNTTMYVANVEHDENELELFAAIVYKSS